VADISLQYMGIVRFAGVADISLQYMGIVRW